jgi:hypothetical protein
VRAAGINRRTGKQEECKQDEGKPHRESTKRRTQDEGKPHPYISGYLERHWERLSFFAQ